MRENDRNHAEPISSSRKKKKRDIRRDTGFRKERTRILSISITRTRIILSVCAVKCTGSVREIEYLSYHESLEERAIASEGVAAAALAPRVIGTDCRSSLLEYLSKSCQRDCDSDPPRVSRSATNRLFRIRLPHIEENEGICIIYVDQRNF